MVLQPEKKIDQGTFGDGEKKHLPGSFGSEMPVMTY